jgi:ribosomal protein L37E
MDKIQCDKCGTDNLSNSKYCCGCGYELPKRVEEPVVPESPAKTKRKLTTAQSIGIAVGIAVAISVSILTQQFLFKKPAIDKVLVEMASEMNKNLPMMIDANTRLDNVMATFGKTVLYSYTITGLETATMDTLAMKQILEPQILNIVKTNPDMKYFRENDITMRYYYKEESGNYLFSIVITPEQYK